MLNKKFLFGAILSVSVLLTACSNSTPEISETVSHTVTTAADVTEAAETTSAASETTVTTTAETEEIDISGVDYIKEALQAEWDDSVAVVNLYTADLNSDNIDELFINYSLGSARLGFVYVYDVSDGAKKLYEIPVRIWNGNSGLYTDEDGKTHFILEYFYSSMSSSEEDFAVFDIAYDEIKQPLFADVYSWFDGGAHVFEYDLYKNCEVVPYVEVFDGWRNFDPEKAEYIGRFDIMDVIRTFYDGEENEVREIIQKEVYEGLTYVSDIDMIYKNSGYDENYRVVWDFEDFWQEAAPKLAEIYGN